MKEEMKEILLCRCMSPEHQILVRSQDGKVYLSVHLVKDGFWKRLWTAVKFAVGKDSGEGCFEDFIFDPEDYGIVQEIADYLRKSKEGKGGVL